jgi:hypothetical protein
MSASLYHSDIVNLATHKLAGVPEEIGAADAMATYLPAQSPDLAIEQVFSKLKVLPQRVRRRGEVAPRNSS